MGLSFVSTFFRHGERAVHNSAWSCRHINHPDFGNKYENFTVVRSCRYTYAQVNAQSLANNVFANFSNTNVESRVYDITTDTLQDTNLLYARQFQNNNGSTSGSTLLDQGTNLTLMLPRWKPDYSVPIFEQSRTYSLQCRRVSCSR